jgi:hypothetical protein
MGWPWAALPEPRSARTLVLAANAAEARVFYAATRNGQIYRSADAGRSWGRRPLSWPAGYRTGNVESVVVVDL